MQTMRPRRPVVDAVHADLVPVIPENIRHHPDGPMRDNAAWPAAVLALLVWRASRAGMKHRASATTSRNRFPRVCPRTVHPGTRSSHLDVPVDLLAGRSSLRNPVAATSCWHLAVSQTH